MINEIIVKSVLNKHKKRNDWFLDDYSVNPYQGCSFNCIYCYSRGSKYGQNMSKTLSVKINAPEVLEKQLRRRAEKEEYGIIFFASQEAYVPIEKKFQMTRKLLEIILKYKFPVHIGTKSTLVLRDLDILKEIDSQAILPKDLKLKHGVIVSFSLASLDKNITKIFESGAPPSKERLETMRKCKKEGFLVGVNLIPTLPFLSDSEDQLEEMIKKAKEYEADFVLVGTLTLFGKGPTDSKTLYYKALEKYYPQLVQKYKSLFRIFFAPPKEFQKKLEEKSKMLCKKYKIKYGI